MVASGYNVLVSCDTFEIFPLCSYSDLSEHVSGRGNLHRVLDHVEELDQLTGDYARDNDRQVAVFLVHVVKQQVDGNNGDDVGDDGDGKDGGGGGGGGGCGGCRNTSAGMTDGWFQWRLSRMRRFVRGGGEEETKRGKSSFRPTHPRDLSTDRCWLTDGVVKCGMESRNIPRALLSSGYTSRFPRVVESERFHASRSLSHGGMP
jgi:hypothetical protein